MDQNKLIDLAWKARENAYVPYSHFKVGACIALKDGTFVQGCNIENAAYGSTMCAERNAVFGAYCKGSFTSSEACTWMQRPERRS